MNTCRNLGPVYIYIYSVLMYNSALEGLDMLTMDDPYDTTLFSLAQPFIYLFLN